VGILKIRVYISGALFFLFSFSFSNSIRSTPLLDGSLSAAVGTAEASASPINAVEWEESWHTMPDRPRPIVAKIYFVGNRAFDSRTLKSKLATRGDSFWGKIGLSFGGHRRASKDWMLKDIGLLNSFYKSRGFLDAASSESFFHDTVKNELWVKIEITEGKQTLFGRVSFAGDAGEFAGPLQKAATDLKSDSAFNQYLLENVLFRMKEIYANAGHPYTRIFLDTVRALDNPKLPLVFHIDQDGLVRFGEVEISGLVYSQPKVVRRELAFKTGEVYSRKKIIRSQQQIYATGLFNFLSLTAKSKTDSLGVKTDTLDLRPDFLLKIVERKPAAVNFHVGIGQYKFREEQQDLSLDLAGGWENHNLTGRGRRLSFSATSSFLLITDYRLLRNKFIADYTEPWLFSSRNFATLSASFEPGVRDLVLGFRIQTATLGLTFFRPIDLTSRFSLGLSLEEISIFDIAPADLPRFKEEQGINVRRQASLAFEKDTRSNILLPSGGSYTRLDGQLLGGPLGGDAHFLKYNFYWNRYQSIAGGNILATRLRVGQAFLVGERGNFPSIDRYYLGGANTLRGYPENSIGPVDSLGKPIGGKSLFLASLEIRRPLVWRFWGDLFSDFGNVFSVNREVLPDNVLVTVGAGLQFVTLIGPLRVEYGKRVIHGTQKPGERVHFSILFAF